MSAAQAQQAMSRLGQYVIKVGSDGTFVVLGTVAPKITFGPDVAKEALSILLPSCQAASSLSIVQGFKAVGPNGVKHYLLFTSQDFSTSQPLVVSLMASDAQISVVVVGHDLQCLSRSFACIENLSVNEAYLFLPAGMAIPSDTILGLASAIPQAPAAMAVITSQRGSSARA